MIISPVFDKESNKPLYIQLYEYIKSEITSGLLKPDSKLPSIREASSTLNLSKTTIENAYSQLVAEGYIDNLPKRGYYVCDLSDYNFDIEEVHKKMIEEHDEIIYLNDGVDKESFDISNWKRLYNKVISDPKTNIYNSCSIQGEEFLREGISKEKGIKQRCSICTGRTFKRRNSKFCEHNARRAHRCPAGNCGSRSTVLIRNINRTHTGRLQHGCR
jgi:GntR family transcriptional regulator/MocR family aminotransferase